MHEELNGGRDMRFRTNKWPACRYCGETHPDHRLLNPATRSGIPPTDRGVDVHPVTFIVSAVFYLFGASIFVMFIGIFSGKAGIIAAFVAILFGFWLIHRAIQASDRAERIKEASRCKSCQVPFAYAWYHAKIDGGRDMRFMSNNWLYCVHCGETHPEMRLLNPATFPVRMKELQEKERRAKEAEQPLAAAPVAPAPLPWPPYE